MTGRTIVRDGAVIANRLITGQLTIKADDVTLRNVVVRSGGYYGVLTYGRRTHSRETLGDRHEARGNLTRHRAAARHGEGRG